MQVNEIADYKKGKNKIYLDTGDIWILYQGEMRRYHIQVGRELTQMEYNDICVNVIGKRAKKRAMHLLERIDRTEYGLREKLKQNLYPEDAIEEAVAYVKKFHYLDDIRYAQNYIHYKQNKKSRQCIKLDLMRKGISKSDIEYAMESDYVADENSMIYELLEKKKYSEQELNRKTIQKIYTFLLRRGFKSEDILKAMKCSDYLT